MRIKLIGGLLLGNLPSFAMPVYGKDGLYYTAATYRKTKGGLLSISDFNLFDHVNHGQKTVNFSDGHYSRIGEQPQFVFVKSDGSVIHGKAKDICGELTEVSKTAKVATAKEIRLVLSTLTPDN